MAANDPGDLPARMADAIVAADAEWTTSREVEWKDHLGAAAMSVSWEHAAAQAAEVERLRAELAETERRRSNFEAAWELSKRDYQYLADQLFASCICDCNPETTGGPEEDCPVHGADEHRPLSLRKRASEAEAERDAVVAAVRTAQITHIREWHPNHAHVGACAGCQVLVPLSRDLPSRPDDPDEIRRLAQASTEETNDEH